MAGSLTSSKVLVPVVVRVDNQDTVAKNWSIEIYEVTADGSNDATSLSISTSLSTILFATAVQSSGSAKAVSSIAIGKSSIKITFAAAPTSATYKVKIEGLV